MKVTIFTDGAARGNPDGPGGYGAIIQYESPDGSIIEKELSGGFPRTTNNRMELMGVIAALEELGKLGEPCEGIIYSDSRYVVDAFSRHWIANWQKNGWKTASGGAVKNQDLWNRLLKALSPHRMSFSWVKGHADHPENERCDSLATAAADRIGSGAGGPEQPTQSSESRGRRPGIPDGRMSAVTAELTAGGSGQERTIFGVRPQLPEEKSAEKCLREHPLKIRIRYISDEIKKLLPPTDSSNWIDLRSAEDVILKKGEYRLIRLGVAMKLPEGYEAHVVPRSSTYKNFGIIQANHHGVIDNSYCGDGDEWRMPVIAMRDTQIHINDRICQFRIERRQPDILFEETDHLEEKDRGGFGTTGIS